MDQSQGIMKLSAADILTGMGSYRAWFYVHACPCLPWLPTDVRSVVKRSAQILMIRPDGAAAAPPPPDAANDAPPTFTWQRHDFLSLGALSQRVQIVQGRLPVR